MKIAEYIDVLETAGRALAVAAAEAGPDAEVPTCPGWRVRDLLRHTSMVHRWATDLVVEAHTTYRPDGGETTLDGDELLAFFREGHAALVAALRAAPESLECWTFLPAPSPLTFWARRQAHETTVHRADAESALTAGPGPVESSVAVDGIDELLLHFHGRDRSRVRTAGPRTLRVRATDTGEVWTVRLSATEPPRTERGDGATGAVDAELVGAADRLYLALWNRLPFDAMTFTGDEEIARVWRETSGV
ncbi:maleylpyruvate isomerase family mycothiol-dependent enzyme [Streptomyces sp. NBC_00572]|uniref:maleylpyruvate isomerase family mycothiol-dependent enzyme n=1 Tax=Streptomyces sp. NBC_00572 TaxID=2903664 RepID=UPI00225C1E96|nr:maleylpyruvate isomerase family mycothiol-dependent enzyme [Streptomyces sp. NBC_00572]MCX4986694.1 maleylpyruvate isomerase family mycothiol-dependent enzyme [Streptomyces sp. NBC_00572]